MEVSKRLEVDFQQISIPWKCPNGLKYHRNLLEVAMISMIWRGRDFFSVGNFADVGIVNFDLIWCDEFILSRMRRLIFTFRDFGLTFLAMTTIKNELMWKYSPLTYASVLIAKIANVREFIFNDLLAFVHVPMNWLKKTFLCIVLTNSIGIKVSLISSTGQITIDSKWSWKRHYNRCVQQKSQTSIWNCFQAKSKRVDFYKQTGDGHYLLRLEWGLKALH